MQGFISTRACLLLVGLLSDGVCAEEFSCSHRARPEQVVAYDYTLKLGKLSKKGIIAVPCDGLTDDEWSEWARTPVDVALRAMLFLPGKRVGSAGGDWERDRAPWRLRDGGKYKGKLLAPRPSDADGVRRIEGAWSFSQPEKYAHLLIGDWPLEGELETKVEFDRKLGIVIQATIEGTLGYPEVEPSRRPQKAPKLTAKFRFREVLDQHSADLQDAVDEAVAQAVGYLKKQKPGGGYGGGERALAVLAMLHADVPETDPGVSRLLGDMQKEQPTGTYATSLGLMALDALTEPPEIRHARRRGKLMAPSEREITPAFRTWGGFNLGQLLTHMAPDGAFHYSPSLLGEPGDFSNTQYGLLGLVSARRMGFEVPPAAWSKLAAIYSGSTERRPGAAEPGGEPGGEPGEEPGEPAPPEEPPAESEPAQPEAPAAAVKAKGFAYIVRGAPDTPYGSMTAAGLAACYALRAIVPADDPNLPGLMNTIEGAKKWLAENWTVRGVPPLHKAHRITRNTATDGWGVYYYLYSLERAGMLGGVERFGEHSWYEEGAWFLLGAQNADGSWGAGPFDTAFAVLFLVRATPPAPVTRE